MDAYATLEEDRLDYIRKNQKNLRSEVYKGIYDAISKGDNDANNIGQRVILPSSYTGSARYMLNNYQDAMAICRQYGNPDLFITFTCNVKWPEIVREFNTKPGYKPEDRPDIVSRLFKIKLDDMINYIKSGEPFGEIEAEQLFNVSSSSLKEHHLPMPDEYRITMSFTYIRDLQPFQFNKKLKVRICRMWRPKLIGSNDQFGGLQCILVDQKTDAIQASVKEIDYDFVAPKIKAGSIYEITHFHTGRNKPSHKIVPHVAQLFFNARTTFKELPTIQPHIPRHRFYLVDYTQLSTRIDKIDILTDVFGHITGIQPLEQKMVGNERLEDKCEVCIENIRKEDVRITLWGNTAKTFDSQALQQLTSPIFAAFTSLKVKQFQGKIVLNSSVSTLIFINPDIQELAAYKTMFKVSLVLEDSTDETNAIIIGRPAEHVRSDFNRNDLLIQAIFDDTMPLLEPTPQSSDKSLAAHDTENIGTQMVPPITPLLSKQIPSASSTSSADASITEATPISKKRDRDAVKRALFTFRPSKKPKSISLNHVQTENESEKMVATKSMEEIVSDSDLPIIGLKKKSSMEKLATSTPTPKLEVKTSIKEKKNHEEIAKQNSPN
ncbi:early nodulin-like protein 7 [Prunus dulcis]|uniref:Early nodulin-like protein 7 n=1 Tax=Prunus dulcis TaxID=3755 RepID=A0A4Y1RE23_PRUDU|nr:early nodulin-like protein 7 [Prunus dulcis]